MVFVATEPPGLGITSRCDPDGCPRWPQFLIDHYTDITTKWNDIMHAYAVPHPDQASYVSVTDVMCRWTSPARHLKAAVRRHHHEVPPSKGGLALSDMLARLLAHR